MAVCALIPLLLHAQTDRGSITGRVVDATDAAISDANVTITNQETGIKSVTKTSATGNYVFRHCPFGLTKSQLRHAGFRRNVRRDARLDVAQTLTLNVALEVGQVEQQIEVTGAAPLIESSTSDLGTVVNRERIVDLPLQVSGNMRHPGSFVFLAPA